MAGLIDDFGGPLPLEPDSKGRPPDLYGALLRSITGQQLSVKAARAIYGRLSERFGGRAPTPQQMAEIAEPWRPHRTRACLYLWRSLDNAPAV